MGAVIADVQLEYLYIYGINTWLLSSVILIRVIKFYDKHEITWVYCLTLEGEIATKYTFVIKPWGLSQSLYNGRPLH
jgi:hypothetical protein